MPGLLLESHFYPTPEPTPSLARDFIMHCVRNAAEGGKA